MPGDRFLRGFSQSLVVKCLYALPFLFIFYFLAPSRLDSQFSEGSSKFYGNSILEEKADQIKSSGGAGRAARDGVSSERGQCEEAPAAESSAIDVMITFKNAHQNAALQRKFYVTVSSMLEHSSVPLRLHIMGDLSSQNIAEELLRTATDDSPKLINYSVAHYDVDGLARKLDDIVRPMQQHFSHSPGAYFSDALFFLSIAIHRVMPETMKKVIMLDADLKFKADIGNLYRLFDEFSAENIMGIAQENQPVYRHVFWEYRSKNPGTRVGEPPPSGLTGFNSGVLLLDVERMRQSKSYNDLLDSAASRVQELTKRYHFKGHLGDQDFFTLLSLEHSELFYVLPCGWNRQLCRWWEDKGYADVFDRYYRCDGTVFVYHGNCNTPIP